MKTLITIFEPDLKKMIFPNALVDRIKQFSQVDIVTESYPFTSSDLSEVVSEYDALITSWRSPKITSDVLEHAQKLQFIGHAAGSINGIVDEAVFEKGITVVNANRALAQSTAELALVLMLGGAWQIRPYVNRLENGGWSNNMTETVMGLSGQTVGLIGLGEISREVIRLLKPFETEILLRSNYCEEEEARNLGVTLCSLEELMKRSSIVSLHNTLTPSTKGMIGRRELSWMQDSALLVNTARAQIIDQMALLAELKQSRLHAALDVFDIEPLPSNHVLRHLPNVLSTPHIGGYSHNRKTKMGELIVDDLERFAKGDPLQRQVTSQMFARMTVNKV